MHQIVVPNNRWLSSRPFLTFVYIFNFGLYFEMNLNSLWKTKRKRSSRSLSLCGHDGETGYVQRRMEHFEKLLLSETLRIQDHMDELAELRCEIKSDCTCRQKFEKQVARLEKRVMKLRGEMQDLRQLLLDSDCHLHKNEQRQRELQHRLQELWSLISECTDFRDVELQKGTPTTHTVPAAAVDAPAVPVASPSIN